MDRLQIVPLEAETVIPMANSAIEIVAVWLDAGLAAVDEMVRCLSGDERGRANRFIFERDRRRFVVARARLRHLLASRLGVRPEAVDFAYGTRGKPTLSRRFSSADLFFNISHSEDLAVYAFSHGRDIGVDVEAIRALSDADAIAARFFSRRENRAYLALDARDKPLGFFNCWTRKEAFIKALGDGLYYPLDRFDVSLAPGEPARILRVAEAAGDACGCALHDINLEPGFVGAVALVERRAGEPHSA